MSIPNLESLLLAIALFGGLANVALALSEYNGRRLLESAGERSTPSQKGRSTTRSRSMN